ncbi:interleukin-10 isoform 1-T1 [Discoglossus pictus]
MKFCALLSICILILKEGRSQSGEEGVFCIRAVNTFPNKLRELRTSFSKVKDYFQMKDDALSTILLKHSLLDEFKSTMGCQSVTEMLRFYLHDVLPRASKNSLNMQSDVGYIEDLLKDLKDTLKRCHNFLPCKKSKTIKQIKDTYKNMQEKGVYKAMGEFNTFINYIEDYLVSKKN